MIKNLFLSHKMITNNNISYGFEIVLYCLLKKKIKGVL